MLIVFRVLYLYETIDISKTYSVRYLHVRSDKKIHFLVNKIFNNNHYRIGTKVRFPAAAYNLRV